MKKKKFEDLNALDNFMFNELAMQKDPEKAQRFFYILLKSILHKEIRSIRIVPQRVIQGSNPQYHGIQTDSYVEAELYDRNGAETSIVMPVKPEIFDIEPNTYEADDEERRMRYYHALIDTKILATGVHYKDMKNVTLIMLSDYDPFKRGRMMYTFERRCLEEPDLEYNDGLRTIYLYAYGTKDVQDEELSGMLKFLADSRRENATTPEIQEIYGMMNEIKKDSEKGVRYMKSWEIEEMRYNQGKEEGMLQILMALVKENKLDKKEAADRAGMSVEQFETFLSSAENQSK